MDRRAQDAAMFFLQRYAMARCPAAEPRHHRLLDFPGDQLCHAERVIAVIALVKSATQRLEARPCAVEILGFEELDPGDPVASVV
jgi:hypothetical protein